MQKLVTASILLFLLFAMNTQAFAKSKELKCHFKGGKVAGVSSIVISSESLLINGELEIPLHKSKVKCGNFGRQNRFDGSALGYMVVLKSCSSNAKLEGDLVDAVQEVAAELVCD